MGGLDWKLLILELVIVVSVTRCRAGESSTCLTVYNEGGAPAVFRSPKCPRWNLPSYDSGPRTSSIRSARCQVAMLQGRRKSQEDRAVCALDVAIPFPGKSGLKEAMVGIVAVFDGHNGAEASEMASKLLLEYFALHTYFLLDAAFYYASTGVLPNKGEKDVFQFLNWDKELGLHNLNFERLKFPFPEKDDDSFHLDILKEALLRAIHDIDATFSKEARLNNLHAGSTATVVLIVDGLILVANIGDSKALLCSEKFLTPAEVKATLLRLHREQRRNGAVSPIRNYDDINLATSGGLKHFIVEELTRDHHPGRDDERFRVENSGGYVTEWGGVPRVNGQLAVSRAIGDISFKGYGVISAPEVTDWHPLTTNDSYLVVASDGVFEKLSLQDVCDLLSEVYGFGIKRSGLSSSCSYSLAECLVNTAFKKGSRDNVATIVVPLEHIGKFPMERCLEEAGIYCSTPEAKEFMPKESASYITPNVVHLKHADQLTTRFDRLLVEGKHGNLGCYYLFENLDDKLDMLQAQNHYQGDYSYDLSRALPQSLNDHYGGHLNLYSDQNLCLYVGMAVDGAKDQCVNPESFANFLSFLESIPFHEAVTNNESTEYGMHNMRYVLKKRFGRGSYGEVWLAFYWNCQKNSNDSSCINSNAESSRYSSTHQCNTSSPDDSLFILKRIMVERGAAVYLSGLREKYFGEVFLNASRCLAGLSDGITTILEEPQTDITELSEMNESVYGFGNSWNFENLSPNKFGLRRAANEEGLNHIVRYVESFESRSNEIWLVFHHEGVSLSKLMYTMEEVESNADEEKAEELKRVQILRPSKWWHWLKTTEAGKEEMRNIIWQLLMALKSCHDRNITHGDIKPENMVICFEDKVTGRCLKGGPTENKNYTTKIRVIDFGSAIDEFTLKHLYGSTGPSRAEQTFEYAPPEAFLNASWYQGPTSTTLKYDMWSVGVVILELILGSPNVFQISALTRALLDPHIEGWNEDLKELAYKLRSLMELCILIPGSTKRHHYKMGQVGVSPASWKCSEEFFSHQIKSRDPLKLGFANIWALRLVRQLLLWHPEDRMNVNDALQHPYFQPPSRN